MLLLSGVLSLAAVGAAYRDTLPPQGSYVIAGARIELGDGRVIESGSVAVKNGVIEQVVSGAVILSGYTLISGTGKTLYPGFIDGFSSRGLKASSAPAGAVRPDTNTTAFGSMWISNRKGLLPEWKAAENIELAPSASLYRQGLTTSLLCPTRGSMRGSAAVVDLLPTGAPGMILNPSAGAGFSFRSGGGAGYPGNILGVIALFRQTLYDAKSLMAGADLFGGEEKKPDWAASLEALAPALKGETPVLFEANFSREIERVADLADEFGFRPVIVGGRDAWRVADFLAAKKIPVILTADLGTEPALNVAATANPADVAPEEVRKERNQRWQEQAAGASVLAQAGVEFIFSSEGGVSDILANVRKRIQRGLPRETALAALTSRAAKLLGISDKAGTIEVGKRANLILMSGDFASEDSKVETVFVDGRIVLQPEAAK